MLTVCSLASRTVFIGAEGLNKLQPTSLMFQIKEINSQLYWHIIVCLTRDPWWEVSQLFQMKSTQQAPRSFISNSRPPEPIPKPVRFPFPHMIWSMLSTAISHSFIDWWKLIKYRPISTQPLLIVNHDALFLRARTISTPESSSLFSNSLRGTNSDADSCCSAGEDSALSGCQTSQFNLGWS